MAELPRYPGRDEAAGLARTSGFAIASLVLGIVGFFALPIVAPILAIVFGKRAQEDIRGEPQLAGEGLANAGIILGWVGLAVDLLAVLLFLFVFAAL